MLNHYQHPAAETILVRIGQTIILIQPLSHTPFIFYSFHLLLLSSYNLIIFSSNRSIIKPIYYEKNLRFVVCSCLVRGGL